MIDDRKVLNILSAVETIQKKKAKESGQEIKPFYALKRYSTSRSIGLCEDCCSNEDLPVVYSLSEPNYCHDCGCLLSYVLTNPYGFHAELTYLLDNKDDIHFHGRLSALIGWIKGAVEDKSLMLSELELIRQAVLLVSNDFPWELVVCDGE